MASSTFPATPSSRACCSAGGPRRCCFSSHCATPSAPGVRRQLRQSFQLFCAPAASPDAADSASARQSAPGCWDQSAPDGTATGAPVFTIAGLAEADLLQQMLRAGVVAACANGSSATPRDSVSKLSVSLRIPRFQSGCNSPLAVKRKRC